MGAPTNNEPTTESLTLTDSSSQQRLLKNRFLQNLQRNTDVKLVSIYVTFVNEDGAGQNAVLLKVNILKTNSHFTL